MSASGQVKVPWFDRALVSPRDRLRPSRQTGLFSLVQGSSTLKRRFPGEWVGLEQVAFRQDPGGAAVTRPAFLTPEGFGQSAARVVGMVLVLAAFLILLPSIFFGALILSSPGSGHLATGGVLLLVIPPTISVGLLWLSARLLRRDHSRHFEDRSRF